MHRGWKYFWCRYSPELKIQLGLVVHHYYADNKVPSGNEWLRKSLETIWMALQFAHPPQERDSAAMQPRKASDLIGEEVNTRGGFQTNTRQSDELQNEQFADNSLNRSWRMNNGHHDCRLYQSTVEDQSISDLKLQVSFIGKLHTIWFGFWK